MFPFQNNCGKSGGWPCKNNASCKSGFTYKGYRCSCTPGFEGEQCDKGEKERCLKKKKIAAARKKKKKKKKKNV